MAIYHVEYHSWSRKVVADTKAKALKAMYTELVPQLAPQGVTYKAFSTGAVAVREKVVKVERLTCPVDGQAFTRKEFVSHVRQQHQSS